ncbi:vitamin B12 ABC transporter substrate-binding protein BtuF [Serratia microhaemolytica]|uniref:vitamin B12 ABC transporter substrate-binding protein BtuF n=1 Tax=Serratia microhaemolytica TaxID=2675110 RepID=UPI000FDEE53F|nr:vitamin B12 ABC transporter substrate-binding protein BtuF [Serratia microhaemolytica]
MRVTALLLALLYPVLVIPLSACHAAQRVISLAPHITELAYAAGLGERLIAVSAHSDYPPAAQQLEVVASWQGIKLERIVALKPDLILAWRGGNPQKTLDQLASLGITIFYLDIKNIDDIAQSLDRLAQYSPHPEQAQQAAQQFRQQIDELTRRYANSALRRVFLQFGTQPLLTSSAGSVQNQVLALCGAANIFADSRVPWPQVSREQVLLRHPEAIVIAGGEQQIANVRAFWAPQLTVPVIALHEDWFNRAGPRIILAAQSLCRQLAEID